MAAADTSTKVYGKAGQDGKSTGDCPFTHKARLALEVQGIPYEFEPIDLKNKPDWYLKINEQGSVPSMTTPDKTITSSDEIVAYADENGKQSYKLKDKTNGLDAVGNVFKAFTSYIQEKDEDRAKMNEKQLTQVLGEINSILEKSGGPFMSGKEFGKVDCDLAPKLYAVKVAAKHFKVSLFSEGQSILTKTGFYTSSQL